MITPSTFVVVTGSVSVHGGGSCADRLHFSLDLMIISFNFAVFNLRLCSIDQASKCAISFIRELEEPGKCHVQI